MRLAFRILLSISLLIIGGFTTIMFFVSLPKSSSAMKNLLGLTSSSNNTYDTAHDAATITATVLIVTITFFSIRTAIRILKKTQLKTDGSIDILDDIG